MARSNRPLISSSSQVAPLVCQNQSKWPTNPLSSMFNKWGTVACFPLKVYMRFSSPHFGPPSIKERMLQAIILHHIYGTLVAYYSLYNGSTLFTMPNYSAESMLQAIPQLKVSCYCKNLASRPGSLSLNFASYKSLRYLLSCLIIPAPIFCIRYRSYFAQSGRIVFYCICKQCYK